MPQPPGKDTLASPKRATKGPRTKMEARIVLTMSYGASSLSIPLPRRVVTPFSCVTLTPIWRSNLNMVLTSCNDGTLCNTNSSDVRSAAHKIGNAAFFAPEIRISPFRRVPPVISNLSIMLDTLQASGFSLIKHGFLRAYDHPTQRTPVDDAESDACLQKRRKQSQH